MPRQLARAAVVSFVAVVVASCSASADGARHVESNPTRSTGHEVDGAATAVWAAAPGQRLDAGSTSFTALVTRLGCNDGATGEVVAPVLTMSRTRIVVSFQVTPGDPGAARCPGNPALPYVVELGEPIAGRPLLDGQCLPGGAAETTSFCDGR